MHSIQCIQALSRMMEEYIANPSATDKERGDLGELLMDFDSVVDNLSTVYEEVRAGDGRYPPAEDLDGAFASYTLTRKP
ncbi:hypothetical protein DBR42_28355 [Pelomonas sp. HMWF004]|nr:hypothetical protein DBR42_28355 [Pelomonas sp. HMWF004]